MVTNIYKSQVYKKKDSLFPLHIVLQCLAVQMFALWGDTECRKWKVLLKCVGGASCYHPFGDDMLFVEDFFHFKRIFWYVPFQLDCHFDGFF